MARKSDQPTRKLPQSTLGVPAAARRATSRQLSLRAASTKSGGGDGYSVLGGHVDVDRVRRGGYAQSTAGIQSGYKPPKPVPQNPDTADRIAKGPKIRGTAQASRFTAPRFVVQPTNNPGGPTIANGIGWANASQPSLGPNVGIIYSPLRPDQMSEGQINWAADMTGVHLTADDSAIVAVNNALGGVPVQLNAIAQNAWNGLYNTVTGNTPPPPKPIGDYLEQQRKVGGTKGSKGTVDRSEALKLAWQTRRKLYGSSGKKAS